MQNGVYIITKYRTLEDLNLLCSFPYRNIKRYEHYERKNAQSGTYTIIVQSGTYTYNAAQVIANYLKPLCSNNEHIIRNTQDPAGIYFLKVNNRNTRKRCEICSKLTINTAERRYWRRSRVFIVNFEHISQLVFQLLNLRM